MPKGLKAVLTSQPVLTVLPYVLIAAAGYFGYKYLFKNLIPNVANFVTDPKNPVNQSFEKVYSTVTGSSQSLGADFYDLLHPNAGALPAETVAAEKEAVAKFNRETGLSASSYNDIIKYRDAGLVRVYDQSRAVSAPGNYWIKLGATDPKDRTPTTGNVIENLAKFEWWKTW